MGAGSQWYSEHEGAAGLPARVGGRIEGGATDRRRSKRFLGKKTKGSDNPSGARRGHHTKLKGTVLWV